MTRPGETPIPGWGCELPIASRSHVAGICRQAKPLAPRCVFTGCLAPVAPGDVLACETCRVKLDATPYVPQSAIAEAEGALNGPEKPLAASERGQTPLGASRDFEEG